MPDLEKTAASGVQRSSIYGQQHGLAALGAYPLGRFFIGRQVHVVAAHLQQAFALNGRQRGQRRAVVESRGLKRQVDGDAVSLLVSDARTVGIKPNRCLSPPATSSAS